jgi:hypothetical protein
MVDKNKRFKVIEGGNNKSDIRKQCDGDLERILCHVCEQHEGTATSVAIPAYASLYASDNDLVKGQERLICLGCLMNGRTTFLT